MKIHSFADVYPMIGDDELQELAEDIKANGLVNPILVMGDVLIDGRNRLAACKLAGVEPTFKDIGQVDDDAIKSMVLSLNNNRRHLSKGQKAMAVAMAYPTPEKGGRGKRLNYSTDFDKGLLSNARKVLRFAPELAMQVMAGKLPLSDAYEEACNAQARFEALERQREADMERAKREAKIIMEAAGDSAKEALLRDKALREENMRHVQARLAIISKTDPDLAAAVNNGTLKIEAVEGILRDREEKEAAIMDGCRLAVRDLLNFQKFHSSQRHIETMAKYLKSQSMDVRDGLHGLVLTINSILEVCDEQN